jgi:hypothetical protein
MSRVSGIDPAEADDRTAAVLHAQATTWGAPLANHLVYARRPTLFKGARGMWSGLAQSGLLDDRLVALVNRRVAAIIGCEF